MSVFTAAERLMGMDTATWERHANPWSGLTRFATLPLLGLAVWSRVWWGWWALPATVLVLAWTWANPRAFSAPKTLDHWMSRAVLGERVWLTQPRAALPAHHVRAARATTVLAATGGVAFVAGLVLLHPWLAIAGGALSILAKTWFCDRMVWLHADVTGNRPGDPLTHHLVTPFEGAAK